jgi:hypothetical protein
VAIWSCGASVRLDFGAGGVAERDRGGGEPGRGELGVELTGVLTAPNEPCQPVDDRLVAAIIRRARLDGRLVEQERVARKGLPPGIEQPPQT